MDPATLRDLLGKLQSGQLSVEAAVGQLRRRDEAVTAATDDAHIDLDRLRRCGFPEVIYSEGKTVEAVVEIVRTLVDHGQACFATRVSQEQADGVCGQFPEACYNAVARTISLGRNETDRPLGKVTVITAGTSDRPVAEEAMETLRWMGCDVELIVDVGVAGPHRLLEHRQRFQDADAVVVVAGMEGALPSVVGGWVDCPVIAVPTSVGYGASFGGVAALLGMLNSCAANVTVVNIDSGFKGGYIAGLIARQTGEARAPSNQESPEQPVANEP